MALEETWPFVWAVESFLKRCAVAPGIESVVSEIDIFISYSGNINIITLGHIKKKMTMPFVRDLGHFDNAIDLACLAGVEGMKVDCTKAQSIFSSSPLVSVA